jgi:hypothetical protein
VLQDRRDDLQFPGAAARAAPQVDVEDALEQPRPTDVSGISIIPTCGI